MSSTRAASVPSRRRDARWLVTALVWASRVAVAMVFFFLAPPGADAQTPPKPSASTAPPATPASSPEPPVAVAPDSPRAAVRDFFDHAGKGDYAEAALYMESPHATAPNAEATARHLQAVLERELTIDLETISPEGTGNTKDDLPPGIDQIGAFEGDPPIPVRVTLRIVQGQKRWVFTKATVQNATARYAHLRSSWLEERLPPSLVAAGPWNVRYWQWLGLVVAGALSVGLGLVLGRASRFVFSRIAKRTRNTLDDDLAENVRGPLALGWTAFVALVLTPWLDLRAGAEAALGKVVGAALALAMFWALARFTDVLKRSLLRAPRAGAHPSATGLIDVGARLAKILLAAVAITFALAQVGYSVTGLVAGLGIGGLAVALAFQKTGENLFASIALGVDQPFRIGDYVNVEGLSGTVEAIGLRSTRIRTLERTVITVPNGKLAEMKIESFAPRDRIRLATTLALAHTTSPRELRAVITGLDRVLRTHPRIWPDSITVRLKELGRTSIDIEIATWFQTSDGDEFLAIKQDVLLQFLDEIAKAGTSLAPSSPLVGPSGTLASLALPLLVPRDRPSSENGATRAGTG